MHVRRQQTWRESWLWLAPDNKPYGDILSSPEELIIDAIQCFLFATEWAVKKLR